MMGDAWKNQFYLQFLSQAEGAAAEGNLTSPNFFVEYNTTEQLFQSDGFGSVEPEVPGTGSLLQVN